MHYLDAVAMPNNNSATKYQNGGLFINLSGVLRATYIYVLPSGNNFNNSHNMVINHTQADDRDASTPLKGTADNILSRTDLLTKLCPIL